MRGIDVASAVTITPSPSDLSAAVLAFLGGPWVARVATVNDDGNPYVVPMWYTFEGGAFSFTTRRSRITARNILRGSRVTCVIDDADLRHYRGIVVEGIGEIMPHRTDEVTRAIAHRYLGEGPGERYAAYMMSQPDRMVFRILPRRYHHWGIEHPDTVARLLAGERLQP